ncbi:MAG: hypothetical protein F6K63_03355 [Moorea sp. SIO1G6]|uniref:hypothetical protein n=1 Tax=Moorena sp. SIO1G6 TaxID=2607840 RepID=UPI0013C03F94|nr:hypothetical protein [Moorena sp. SIO1G6]NET63486.1 hypothetical protein [Moorena sp. SIO1G6]
MANLITGQAHRGIWGYGRPAFAQMHRLSVGNATETDIQIYKSLITNYVIFLYLSIFF